MLFQLSPLSLELGVVEGQVVQAFRTENQFVARTIKNGLKNTFTDCRLSNLPDEAFVPQGETSIYFADVQLSNDLFSIRRWKELLTESDPLTGILASLAVNQHARFFGHVSISMIPLDSKRLKIHRDCFLTLQNEFFQKHDRVAHLFESAARSDSPVLRTFARPLRLLGRDTVRQEPSITVGSSRHHERETDTQSASNKLNSSCFIARIRIRVFGPADQMHFASSLIHQIFAPLAQYNSPRLYPLIPIE
ncbi:MAG: hypothetical protein AAF939_17375 [Planctomycetota bacterium]